MQSVYKYKSLSETEQPFVFRGKPEYIVAFLLHVLCYLVNGNDCLLEM